MLKIRIENDTRCYGSDLIISAIYEINHYLNQATANGVICMSYDLEDHNTTFELSTGIHSVILLADVHNYNEPANRISALGLLWRSTISSVISMAKISPRLSAVLMATSYLMAICSMSWMASLAIASSLPLSTSSMMRKPSNSTMASKLPSATF